MSAYPDLEIRRALLEEARDRLRGLRKAGRTEAMLAVHSLAASAAASGVKDLLSVLTTLQRRLSAGEDGALERALSDVLSALERTERGDDDSAELLECFMAEAAEHLDNMDAQLRRLTESPAEPDALDELSRALHTLKGSAAIVGQSHVSGAAHELEEVLQGARSERGALEGDHREALLSGAARMRALVEQSSELESPPASGAGRQEPEEVRESLRETTKHTFDRRRRVDRRRDAPFVLRVPIDCTQELLLETQEGTRGAARLEEQAEACSAAAADLLALQSTLTRLAHRLPRREAKELGLVATDLAGASAAVERSARDVRGDAARIRAAATRSRRLLAELRETPAAWLFDQLRAVADEAAQKSGKAVTVEVRGESTAVDRSVAARILEPLIHIVRNAVVHGCEPSAQRVALGKEASGRIELEARRSPGGVRYTVRDDGSGIDVEGLARKLVELGARTPEQVDRSTRRELVDAIFLPGLSTTSEVDELSGRGVGLDAVRAAVTRLGGTVAVATDPGIGTTFTVEVPRGIGKTRALVVSFGKLRFGVPVAVVKRIESLPRRGSLGGRLLLDEGDLGVTHLAEMLGLRKRPLKGPVALVVETSKGPHAVEVDRPSGVLEVTAHSLGGLLAGIGPYTGVALDDEGEPLLMLDPEALVAPLQGARVSAQTPRVLVVDDSRTVRALAAQALSSAGYEVEEAADGAEGLRKLCSDRYDLLLTDLEMPRLDGLALIERLREDPRLSRLPVVILTSRSDVGARERARRLLVRAFVTKPVSRARLVREVEGALTSPTGNFSTALADK